MNEADATLLWALRRVRSSAFHVYAWHDDLSRSRQRGIGSHPGAALLLCFFSLPITFILGGPLFMVFRYFDLVRWWSALGSGFAVVAVIAAYLRAADGLQAQDFLTILLGGSSGLAFWAVWRLGGEAPQSEAIDPPRTHGLP